MTLADELRGLDARQLERLRCYIHERILELEKENEMVDVIVVNYVEGLTDAEIEEIFELVPDDAVSLTIV